MKHMRIFCGLLFSISQLVSNNAAAQQPFPYSTQGLSGKEAAAHILNRFTYGATAHEVDAALKMGLERWFISQLDGKLPEDSLLARLKDYDILRMGNTEIIKTFPKPIQVMRMAAADGIIPKDSIKLIDDKAYRKRMGEYVKTKNIRRQSDLIRQFIGQRIVRAAYANNQLHEVLTGFWFNHFNVSLTKREAVLLMPSYEKDAIRPFVTSRFEDMLLATAKSPAMLIYLDNFSSVGSPDNTRDGMVQKKRMAKMESNTGDSAKNKKVLQRLKSQGLNENYAREVMELHTLGVDGGYTQQDVTEAARILTGWTLYPMEEGYSPFLRRLIDQQGEEKLLANGFVRDGDFMFAMNRHDAREKKVLGKLFPAGGGYDEGVTLLKMLADHPSTAKFISQKMATYFVADNPPAALVNEMAATFTKTKGNIREVILTMVYSPFFWGKEAVRSKTKSPFELAISAVRATGTDIEQPYQLFTRIDKMGQKIYYFPAPTGFPDRAAYWINTGALLNRMNFGLDIASQRQRGVQTNLLALNNNHEPESAIAALQTYAALLMPGRDLQPTIKRLTPLLNDPAIDQKIRKATVTDKRKADTMDDDMRDEKTDQGMTIKKAFNTAAMLAQVVGIIIGSPEFQRR